MVCECVSDGGVLCVRWGDVSVYKTKSVYRHFPQRCTFSWNGKQMSSGT